MPGENAPSPKRARIDSGTFNPQQMGSNVRAPGMVPQAPNGNAPNATMLINSSFDPNSMSPAFNQLNGQPKSAQQLYSQELVNHQRSAMGALPKGATPTNGMPHGSPMMATGPDGQMMQAMPADMFPPGAAQNMRGGGGPGVAGGNGGALADYQMQLMLLEQQNKKRLMMARQETDVAQRSENNGVPMPNYAPAMSPRGSRTGHSPGSNDPTKRATPKMSQDSPLADGIMGGNRISPAPTNFEQGPMPPNMVQPFNMMGGPNGMMMRPGVHPASAQMSQQQQMDMLRQQHMRVPNGPWGPGMHNPGQMTSQGQMLQQPQMDLLNQQRNHMPPPQGPPAGRTQPPSPQQSVAPPTPSQANKANPKAKKDNKDTKKVFRSLHSFYGVTS